MVNNLDQQVFVTVIVLLQSLFCFLVSLRYISSMRNQYSIEGIDPNQKPLTIGEQVPAFKSKTLDDTYIHLDDLGGFPTVFIFFGPDCPHCREEIPPIFASMKLEEKVHFVLISYGDSARTRKWKKDVESEYKFELKMPIIVSKQVFHLYNPGGNLPYFCYFDEKKLLKSQNHLKSSEWKLLVTTWTGRNGQDVSAINRYK
jgi:thiol-disulfide isomerase/thioredoxin